MRNSKNQEQFHQPASTAPAVSQRQSRAEDGGGRPAQESKMLICRPLKSLVSFPDYIGRRDYTSGRSPARFIIDGLLLRHPENRC